MAPRKQRVENENGRDRRQEERLQPSSSSGPRRSSRLRGKKVEDKNGDQDTTISRRQQDYGSADEYVPPADDPEEQYDSEGLSDDESKPKRSRKVEEEEEALEDDLQQALDLSLLQQSGTSGSGKPVHQSKRKKKSVARSVFNLSSAEIDGLYHAIVGAQRGLSFQDLQTLAATHNFTWNRHELQDMISLFDGDDDGMLNLDEFRKMSVRCRILELPEALQL